LFIFIKNDEEMDQRLKCPRCKVVKANLKDNEEINRKKILLKKFDDQTLVLFDLLNGIEKL
jgi:phage FluMu protein Com